ncbi:MAG: hypothetical protein AAF630_09880 [Cyanobacteria bacterium P01_C01_bin.38]
MVALLLNVENKSQEFLISLNIPRASRINPNYQLPMPNPQCPIPHSQLPTTNYQLPN